MINYSQNNEQVIILDYFALNGIKKGSFLDLGAYDGVNLSNTRALAMSGWRGVMVEPHPAIFADLRKNYNVYSNDVLLVEAAVGITNGTFKLHANPSYYSTLIESETNRWKGVETFEVIDCPVITFVQLALLSKDLGYEPFTFDFISIDCEGMDYAILKQMNLEELGCKLICVETNGIETQKYIDHCAMFGMHEIARNAENLIMGL